MSSNTDKGKEVRRYYEKIEKLLQESSTLGFVIDKTESRLGLGSKCFI